MSTQPNADDFSPEAEQYRYEHGQHVLNTKKVTRKFGRECLMWHGDFNDGHADTKNGVCTCCGAVESAYEDFAHKVAAMTDNELRESLETNVSLFWHNKNSGANQEFLSALRSDGETMQAELRRRQEGYTAASEHLGKLL